MRECDDVRDDARMQNDGRGMLSVYGTVVYSSVVVLGDPVFDFRSLD